MSVGFVDWVDEIDFVVEFEVNIKVMWESRTLQWNKRDKSGEVIREA